MSQMRHRIRGYVYDTLPGDYLDNVVAECVRLAAEKSGPMWWQMMTKKRAVVKLDFNGVEMLISDRVTAEQVIAYFKSEMARESEEYRNSPAGLAQAAKTAATDRMLQERLNEAMDTLPTLDFTDLEALVNWLAYIQPATDRGSVVRDTDTILATFAEHGYLPGVNCGDDFVEDDKDNFGRWVIGTALGMLDCEVHAIHDMYHSPASKWRAKFDLAPYVVTYGWDGDVWHGDDEDDEGEE